MKNVFRIGLIVFCCQCVVASRPPVSVAPTPKVAEVTSSEPESHIPITSSMINTSCGLDMRHVSGNYCPEVEQKCLRWLDKDLSPTANSGIGPLQCAEFEYPAKCLSTKRVKQDFCMDTYEWPNKEGSLPPVGMTWNQAKASCEGIGKRLCTTTEWTFACETEEIKPYPYGDGYHRDDTACNIDKPSMDPSLPRSEWPKYYKGVPSGSMERCVSSFGVHDMTGNVDEFVNYIKGNKDKDPFFSSLKGGYWGPVRARCRPTTTAHGPDFSFYQIGFRCCTDSKLY